MWGWGEKQEPGWEGPCRSWWVISMLFYVASVKQELTWSYLCSFSWAVGCQGQDGGRVLQVRDGGGPGDIQGCGEEQTREGCGGRGGRTRHCLFCGVWGKGVAKGRPSTGFLAGQLRGWWDQILWQIVGGLQSMKSSVWDAWEVWVGRKHCWGWDSQAPGQNITSLLLGGSFFSPLNGGPSSPSTSPRVPSESILTGFGCDPGEHTPEAGELTPGAGAFIWGLYQGWGRKDGRQLATGWRLRACELLFVVRLWNDQRHLRNGLLPERGKGSAPRAVDGTRIAEGRGLYHFFGHVVSHVWVGGQNTALGFQVALPVWPVWEGSLENCLPQGFSI